MLCNRRLVARERYGRQVDVRRTCEIAYAKALTSLYADHKKDEISGSADYGNVSELFNETLNHTDLDP